MTVISLLLSDFFPNPVTSFSIISLVLSLLYFPFPWITYIGDSLAGFLLWRSLLYVLRLRDCPSFGDHLPCLLRFSLYCPNLITLFPRFPEFFHIGDFLFAFRFRHMFRNRPKQLIDFGRFFDFDTPCFWTMRSSSFFKIRSLALSNTRYSKIAKAWRTSIPTHTQFPEFPHLIYRRNAHLRIWGYFYIRNLLSSKSSIRQFPNPLNLRFLHFFLTLHCSRLPLLKRRSISQIRSVLFRNRRFPFDPTCLQNGGQILISPPCLPSCDSWITPMPPSIA